MKEKERRQPQWMTIEELIVDTGLGRSTVYNLAQTNQLPVPVIRMGRQYLISRRAWEALKGYDMEPEVTDNTSDQVVTNHHIGRDDV